jgi:hypothetical protein
MSEPPSNVDLPEGDEAPEETGDEGRSDQAASDPEAARREAEEALAEIEALADLDEEPDLGDEGPTEDEAPGGAASETGAAAEPDAPSEGGEETGAGPEEGPLEDQCENCGALLHGPYCSQCGQKAADRIVPIWHMINEALEAVFELDLRVLRTMPKFLFLPGRLTKEYINGRRKRYLRPFRLYLFATFVLFAVIALTTTGTFGIVLDPQGMARLNPPSTGITLGGGPDSTVTAGTSSVFGDPEGRERLARQFESDSVRVSMSLYDDPAANERLEELLKQRIAQALRTPWAFVNSMIDRGPYLMFLMLPIFALLLKLLYVRRGRLYVEHLIFSLHVHALAFFAFTVGLLLDQSEGGWLETTATWVELSPLLYLVLAMAHVYDQGLLKSTVKASILLLIYSVILSFGFVLLLFAALLFS